MPVYPSRKFIIDGKEYGSLEEMPVELRQKFQNLMPGDATDLPEGTQSFSQKFVINGQEINLESLSPEDRARFEKAMEQMDANHNGVPDLLESENPLVKMLLKNLVGVPPTRLSHPTAQTGSPTFPASPRSLGPTSPDGLPPVNPLFPDGPQVAPPDRRPALILAVVVVLAVTICLVAVFGFKIFSLPFGG